MRVDANALLDEVGIPRSIMHDADLRVSPERALALVRAAIARTGDENLGLHLAQLYQPGVFGTLDHLAHAARTLREAIEVLLRYERIHQNGMTTILEVSGDDALITHHMKHPYALPRQVSENMLANLIVIGRHLTGLELVPREVAIAHPQPADCREIDAFFGCPIRWNADCDQLVIDSALLSASLLKANPSLAVVLEHHARSLLARTEHTALVAAVRDRIGAALATGDASVTRVSAALGQSARTMQRRLAEERTSFADLLDAVRKELAVEYIARKGTGIAEAALLLGFSDDRAFRRAFRRWTGESPAEFRARRAQNK